MEELLTNYEKIAKNICTRCNMGMRSNKAGDTKFCQDCNLGFRIIDTFTQHYSTLEGSKGEDSEIAV